jgi:hypothetical protein
VQPGNSKCDYCSLKRPNDECIFRLSQTGESLVKGAKSKAISSSSSRKGATSTRSQPTSLTVGAPKAKSTPRRRRRSTVKPLGVKGNGTDSQVLANMMVCGLVTDGGNDKAAGNVTGSVNVTGLNVTDGGDQPCGGNDTAGGNVTVSVNVTGGNVMDGVDEIAGGNDKDGGNFKCGVNVIGANVTDGGDETGGGNDKVTGNVMGGVNVTGGNVMDGGKEMGEVQANGWGKVHEKVSTNSSVSGPSLKSPKDTTPSPPVLTGMLNTKTTNTLTLNSDISPSSGLSPIRQPEVRLIHR